MLRLQLISSVVLLLLADSAIAQTENSFATGGYNTMHFNANDMDIKGDNKITKGEWMAYAEKMWDSMANGKRFLPIHAAAKYFAEGGLSVQAEKMDTNHDGVIGKKEYLTYFYKKFDEMKHPHAETISVQEAAEAFSRGEPPRD